MDQYRIAITEAILLHRKQDLEDALGSKTEAVNKNFTNTRHLSETV